MSITSYLSQQYPTLKDDLLKARMRDTPEQFVERSFRVSVMGGVMFFALVFLFFSKQGPQFILYAVIAGAAGWYATFWYLMKSPILAQQKVAVDIDKEVLFAGRFLLVKLNSGTPLVNALVEASNSYGVSNRYFLEIVRDIELGTPLEEAIEKAMLNSPSKHWRRILFQIHNALKLGIDVTHSLEAVLDDISYEILLQIQRYGKKLSSLTLFYLLLAVVFPSLGMTIMTVLISFTEIQLSAGFFITILVFVLFIQLIFMRIFSSVRPKVTL